MPQNLQASCPNCGNVCVYRATSAGREMRCPYCQLLFRRPAPPGIPIIPTAGVGCFPVAALLCAGFLYLGGWRPGSTPAVTEAERSKDDKPKTITQKQEQQKQEETTTKKQQEDAAQERQEEIANRKKQAEEKLAEIRRIQAENKRKAEEKKAEERAAAFLRYAKKMADRGQTDIAKERLQDILRDMPKTEAAKEARQLLEKLTP